MANHERNGDAVADDEVAGDVVASNEGTGGTCGIEAGGVEAGNRAEPFVLEASRAILSLGGQQCLGLETGGGAGP